VPFLAIKLKGNKLAKPAAIINGVAISYIEDIFYFLFVLRVLRPLCLLRGLRVFLRRFRRFVLRVFVLRVFVLRVFVLRVFVLRVFVGDLVILW